MTININVYYDKEDKDVHVTTATGLYKYVDYGYVDNSEEVKDVLKYVMNDVLEELIKCGLKNKPEE